MIVGVAALCWTVGSQMSGVLLLGVVALIVAIMQTISVRRFKRLSRTGGLIIDGGPRTARG